MRKIPGIFLFIEADSVDTARVGPGNCMNRGDVPDSARLQDRNDCVSHTGHRTHQ